ncbi:LysM peptidoglycan-binding domain-containing M23 family metallopeptidase [uncultured Roseobacter sp.]|uniref:LysM peptidoglycan-binding domain-containing M23 family metallopeptidase n=1 Tax=uncultured Roseobacter sp. TaxID=114847 RepID=UPI002637B58C|nr:LysM peptidoglycan-binding domain-containing M23 family metallopeptidase [uncultured Roseobacter sp.]
MIRTIPRGRAHLAVTTAGALILLAACDQPLDFDLRGGGFGTAEAASSVQTTNRPAPDSRGVISYPTYQVAVAERGDTINDIAGRLGVNAAELARFNGIDTAVPLREGEVVALPARVSEPAGAAGTAQPGAVDIGTLAGGAIDRAPQSSSAASPSGVQTAALPPASASASADSEEPIRHKVVRGETAFTISRLYNVPVKSLAEWNGLGPDFAIREGQFLLIPVARQAPPAAAAAAVTEPGTGTPTPTPPSAAKPLPAAEAPVKVAEPQVDVGEETIASTSARMVFPLDGTIIRAFSRDKNPGIDIKADPGSPVLAADAGVVGSVLVDTDGVPIIVLRHEPQLLTAYVNVTNYSVKKGDKVSRGQQIGTLGDDKDAFLHFEVIEGGLERVDPMLYLK